MNRFELYFGYFNFPDNSGGKERPLIIISYTDENEYVTVFAVYSHKKWFAKDDEKLKQLCKIHDIKSAGLLKKSYIDISYPIEISKSMLSNYKYLGRLSSSDTDILLDRISEYYQ